MFRIYNASCKLRLFIKHNDSSPTENKIMSTTQSLGKVIFRDVVKSTVSTWIHLRSCYYSSLIVKEGFNWYPRYAPIRIQCVNALVDKGKYNEFSIGHNKLIMLYLSINHVNLNLGYFPKIMVQM